MDILKTLLVVDKTSTIPVYLQIANAFIQKIHEGRFRKGLKLPGSREMAGLLKVNRMTAVAAYQELDAQGWIELIPRKGTFVKVHPSVEKPAKLGDRLAPLRLPEKPGFHYDTKRVRPLYAMDFPPAGKIVLYDGGFPDVRLAPIEELARRIRSLARIAANKKYLMYGNAQGTLFLRETLADFLCDTRGLNVTADNILITKGAQMGIYIASSILLQHSDAVVVGTPGYVGANNTFRQLGARIHYVPVYEDGIDVDAVEKLCRKRKIRMVYVIPHHHHPTTATLSPDKRIALLRLAAKFRFAIIEDDYDYDFHYGGKPMMPMASVDRKGNVVYIGTLTKSLAPAIRLGFIVAPVEFIRVATHLRKSIDTQGDSLVENAVAELYKDNTITRHIKKSLKLYKDRRDHFCRLMEEELQAYVSFKVPDGGMSVWTRFTKHSLPILSRQAFDKGLIMRDGTDYDTPAVQYNSVGLGFASLNDREQERAIGILKNLLAG
ncbi:MAG TPA: PLP-dependent aminotransferase family protein [Ohtaekwangia sp.]|nr:PLP-dependent aminotransferase family protein [Ohtaekwangia sp.]